MNKLFAVTAVLALLGLSVAASAAITIDTVAVGDAGNAGELSGSGVGGYGPDRICGSVDYNYRIGKYEVTAGQYTAFLNAVAATDTHVLYDTGMSNATLGCGITRTGTPGSYTYAVADGFANRPVNYVTYWDACRFTNWLSNGQGSGDTESGAYTLNGYNGGDGAIIERDTEWKWAVASEDEWYKAAYYKGGGSNAGYWLYPTSTNAAPGRDLADGSGNNANYFIAPGPYPIDSGKYTTVVGEFQNSDSPYGTFDQGGNLFEWTEDIISGSGRGLRGGSFGYGDGYVFSVRALQSASRSSYGYSPSNDGPYIGFRVVQAVPEPPSVVALAGGLAAFWGLRRRRA